MKRFQTTILLLLFTVYINTAATIPTGKINVHVQNVAAENDESEGQGIPKNSKETEEIHTGENAERENGEITPLLTDDFAARSSSSGIFQNIMNNIRRGQVTQESLNKWLNQLQTAMSRGTISSESVNRFLSMLKEKFAGTTFGDTCCIVG
ncbi:uncharacterized protein LOC132738785 [Ruditapes philippinarum]|uniref:uncharacterized protein LOC132738785 n=1 Tax=Ruditapes philippinarum TaxID=129788 RepID=UPI00295B25E2|nr:uncharacterized protein LOC132738785 [Ruditapes philippinarum]